jgi:hypothetical protein
LLLLLLLLLLLMNLLSFSSFLALALAYLINWCDMLPFFDDSSHEMKLIFFMTSVHSLRLMPYYSSRDATALRIE